MTNLKLILNILTGSALIICGSFVLSKSLEKIAGRRMPHTVESIRKSDGKAFAASIAVTALAQSSSAVTAIAVSLAESGILRLSAAMAVVYGANIGTTVTAQMMSVNRGALGLYILSAGAAFKLASCIFKKKGAAADALLGAGMIFTGLSALSLSAELIKESHYIMNFINLYSQSPVNCLFFGFVTTALLQSSSATVGLSIALFSGGVIGFKQAAALTLGDNIGTCVTALLASAAFPSNSANGRRVAWGNIIYNIICSVTALVFLNSFICAVTALTGFLGQSTAYLVANAHTLLNILGALLFMPLNKVYCGFLELLIPEEDLQ